MSNENSTPSTPAPAAPVAATPATENKNPSLQSQAKETIEANTKANPETASTETKSEVKAADSAADKTGAEKVSADQYELKVDGELVVLNREEMIKWAQMGKAGQKRLQESAEYKKQTEKDLKELARQLKENPEAVLEAEGIGHNKYELAKKWLAEKMELDAKSPEQIELETLRKENAAIKAEKEAEAKRIKEEAHKRETEQNITALEKEIVTAFKTHNLPNSSATIDRITGIMEFAENNNLKITADDAAKIVKDEIRADIQSLTAMLSDDDYEAFLGETGIKRIKDRTLKKMKAAPSINTPETAKVPTKEEPRKKVSVTEWMKPNLKPNTGK